VALENAARQSEASSGANAVSSSRPAVEAYEYPACPGAPLPAWSGWVEASEDEEPGRLQYGFTGEDGPESVAEASRRSFEAGRERGRQEGHQAEHEAQGAAIKTENDRHKSQLAELVEDFAAERDRYLRAVEHEVVKLALAVAGRILRREAQMDPLLLTGAVRVALGQLAGTSEAQLRVPASEVDMWTEAIALVPNLSLKPAVVAGEGMRLGDCVIASKVGTVDLGVHAQLHEIERGFFDRAGAGESFATQDAASREAHA
jgi:flagellar assembly protein FliH